MTTYEDELDDYPHDETVAQMVAQIDRDEDEVLYPDWLEEDQRDRHEEAYNEWLMHGGDL